MSKNSNLPQCRRVWNSEFSHQLYSFGIKDRLHREMGVIVQTFEAAYEAADPGYFSTHEGYRLNPGQYFEFWCVTSRNGAQHGAKKLQGHFYTKLERDAYVDQVIAEAIAKAKGLQS